MMLHAPKIGGADADQRGIEEERIEQGVLRPERVFQSMRMALRATKKLHGKTGRLPTGMKTENRPDRLANVPAASTGI